MGGDHGPSVVVGGVKAYRARYDAKNIHFLLHGDEAAIRQQMQVQGLTDAECTIRHTEKVVAMDEKPAQAMRRGKGSSMWNAIEAVKTGEAHAVVSAGNTGYGAARDAAGRDMRLGFGMTINDPGNAAGGNQQYK